MFDILDIIKVSHILNDKNYLHIVKNLIVLQFLFFKRVNMSLIIFKNKKINNILSQNDKYIQSDFLFIIEILLFTENSFSKFYNPYDLL